MANTRRDGVDWDRFIVYGGSTMSLRRWLRLVYRSKSDRELAEVLCRLGFNATKTALCRARQRFGFHKKPGQAVMVEGGLDIEGMQLPAETGETPVLADMAEANEHEVLKQQVLNAIKDDNVPLSGLSHKFDRAEPTIQAIIDELIGEGFPIVSTETAARLDTKTAPSVDIGKEVPTPLVEMTGHYCPFGIMTDLHAGSVSMQITNMIAFVRYAYAAGVRHVFVPGDLFAGHKVYTGQLNDLFAVGADKQLIVLQMALPVLPDLTYYVIGGNHDFCVDEKTEALTRRGWLTMDRLSPDDEIATLNPETHAFEWQKLSGLTVNDYSGEMLHFSHRGVDHLVTPNHDMYVQSHHTLEWRKKKAGSTWAKIYYRCKKSADSWRGNNQESIEIPRSMKREGCDLPTDKFAELASWYISEGHIDRHSRITICQSQNSKYYQEICELVRQLGFDPKLRSDMVRFNNAPLAQFLENEFGNHSYKKRIPSWIKDWDKPLLETLLLAYLKGDGTPNARGNGWTATTASDQLVDDLQEIAAKIGWKSFAGKRREFPVGNTGYVGTARRVSLVPDDVPNWLHKKPKRVDYIGRIWCPQVGNGIWLARRNGCVMWTGNSFIKLGGADLVRVFAAARDDVVYLGYDVADVPLTDRASIRLWHMTGGRAYAISYKLQRGIEQFSFDELMKLITGLQENPVLRFVLAGHLHAAFWSIFGPITGFQCGAFEGQTSLTKRKGWWSITGGFIVEAWITDNGLIQRERVEWVPGIEVKLDYLNYPDIMAAVGAGPQPEKPDTLFTWKEELDT